MKRFLFAIVAVLLAVPALAQDLVFREGRDSVRLHEAPCKVKRAIDLAGPNASRLRAATAVIGGQTFKGCYLQSGPMVHMLWEDGDVGVVPLEVFTPAKGV